MNNMKVYKTYNENKSTFTIKLSEYLREALSCSDYFQATFFSILNNIAIEHKILTNTWDFDIKAEYAIDKALSNLEIEILITDGVLNNVR